MYKSNFAVESIDMSLSALTRGLEWNYRITKKQSEKDFNHYKNTFNNLFFNKSICINDEELKAYSKRWVSNKKIEKREKEQSNIKKLYKPRGAQIEALYELKKTRLDNMDKALVVAATGIGKTYLAAFDSIKFNRILFVAHREEILIQSERSFKNVRSKSKTGFLCKGKKELDCDIL